MYYKVVNKESEVYQKLRALREDERRMDKENRELILQNVPCEWSHQYAFGQQSIVRTIEYVAFKFINPSKCKATVWKQYINDTTFFEPNRKSKEGRRISELLRNGLQQSHFTKIGKILRVDTKPTFTIPYLELFDDIILLFIDKVPDQFIDVIEITESEFLSIIMEYKERKQKETQP